MPAADGRDRADLFNQAVEKRIRLVAVLKSVITRAQAHGDDVVRIEAGRNTLQSRETADQQAGANEQHQGERQFGNHEQSAQPVARKAEATVALRASSTGFKRAAEIEADRAQSGGETKDQPGDDRHSERKRENASIDANHVEARNISGIHGADNVQAPFGDEESGSAAGEA